MARRKKSRSSSTPSILPAWIWLTLGIIIGLGIAMLTRMNGRYLEDDQANSATTHQSIEEPAKRKFDFYTLLPELEIVIPQEETTPLAKKPTAENKASQTSAYTGGYLLQAGSFQQFNEADSLKARLALLGVQATIQSVDVNNKKWHRVHVGPSNDREALEKLRTRLRTNGVDTLLMQAKN